MSLPSIAASLSTVTALVDRLSGRRERLLHEAMLKDGQGFAALERWAQSITRLQEFAGEPINLQDERHAKVLGEVKASSAEMMRYTSFLLRHHPRLSEPGAVRDTFEFMADQVFAYLKKHFFRERHNSVTNLPSDEAVGEIVRLGSALLDFDMGLERFQAVAFEFLFRVFLIYEYVYDFRDRRGAFLNFAPSHQQHDSHAEFLRTRVGAWRHLLASAENGGSLAEFGYVFHADLRLLPLAILTGSMPERAAREDSSESGNVRLAFSHALQEIEEWGREFTLEPLTWFLGRLLWRVGGALNDGSSTYTGESEADLHSGNVEAVAVTVDRYLKESESAYSKGSHRVDYGALSRSLEPVVGRLYNQYIPRLPVGARGSNSEFADARDERTRDLLDLRSHILERVDSVSGQDVELDALIEAVEAWSRFRGATEAADATEHEKSWGQSSTGPVDHGGQSPLSPQASSSDPGSGRGLLRELERISKGPEGTAEFVRWLAGVNQFVHQQLADRSPGPRVGIYQPGSYLAQLVTIFEVLTTKRLERLATPHVTFQAFPYVALKPFVRQGEVVKKADLHRRRFVVADDNYRTGYTSSLLANLARRLLDGGDFPPEHLVMQLVTLSDTSADDDHVHGMGLQVPRLSVFSSDASRPTLQRSPDLAPIPTRDWSGSAAEHLKTALRSLASAFDDVAREAVTVSQGSQGSGVPYDVPTRLAFAPVTLSIAHKIYGDVKEHLKGTAQAKKRVALFSPSYEGQTVLLMVATLLMLDDWEVVLTEQSLRSSFGVPTFIIDDYLSTGFSLAFELGLLNDRIGSELVRRLRAVQGPAPSSQPESQQDAATAHTSVKADRLSGTGTRTELDRQDDDGTTFHASLRWSFEEVRKRGLAVERAYFLVVGDEFKANPDIVSVENLYLDSPE